MKTFSQSINKAIHDSMLEDSSIVLFGLGVNDPKYVFNSTKGLKEKFGVQRVFDSPLSENTMTGFALGLAYEGYKSILVHQRADFAFTSFEQLVNQVAKTYFTTNGKITANLTIRMLIGRGWGQGPTHSQSPHTIFANIPGLKVVMPFSPKDAYFMMKGAIRDPNPVIFLEHRWLYENHEEYDTNIEQFPWNKPEVISHGDNITFVGMSIGVGEAIKIAEIFLKFKVKCDVINLKSISPLNLDLVIDSVRKTKKLVLIDVGHISFGVTKVISDAIMRKLWGQLDKMPLDFGLPHIPVPSSPHLAKKVYLNLIEVIKKINIYFNLGINEKDLIYEYNLKYSRTNFFEDQPEFGIIGPF